jgi:phospholipid/cholesterol/gamma-HCH transport system ATP-binding protein
LWNQFADLCRSLFKVKLIGALFFLGKKLSSRRLDDLILELRANLGATIVVVTHELASIFTIANNSVFLDAESRTQIATGDPHDMLAHSTDPRVRKFLTRGQEGGDSAGSHE